MRALFYLLALTFCCLLKNSFCGLFEDFKSNDTVKRLLEQYNNKLIKRNNLLIEVNKIKGFEKMPETMLKNYLHLIKKAAGDSQKSISIDLFKSNPDAMSLVGKYKDEQNNEINTQEELLNELNKIEGIRMCRKTLIKYLKDIGNPGSSTSASNKGKSTNFSKASNKGKSTNFLKKNSDNLPLSSIPGSAPHYGDAMPSQQAPPMDDDTFMPSQVGTDSMNWLGENLQSNDEDLDSVVNPKNPSLFESAMGYVSSLVGASPQEPQFSPSMHDTSAASSYYPSNQPDDQTLQSMITSRNPSSMPYQQAPPMQDTFVPFQAGTDSTNSASKTFDAPPFPQAPQIARQSSNFTSGNPGSSTSASEKGKSTNFSKKNSGNWSLSSITGFVSNLVGASPQEPQFSPSMHDTAAASSYYPSNQPDDQTLQSMITPRNQKASHYGSAMSYQQVPPVQDTFVPSEAGTDSTDWYGWNSQNNDGALESMIRKPSSSEGFYGTPFLPNQLQSTGWPGASNFFSSTPNTSNFNSGNPGSSAIPFQQAPLPGTSLAFPNYLNQSAQLNSSTNFGPFQTETHSLDWSGGNSHNNTGTLDSVVNKRKPSSSKDKNATKTGKKPRK